LYSLCIASSAKIIKDNFEANAPADTPGRLPLPKPNNDRHLIRRFGIFGSVAKGTSTVQSDVDIVVELERKICSI